MYFQKLSIPPLEWQQKFRGDGGGGGSKKRQFQRVVGGCYRGLFPGGLSDHEIGELLINNWTVEKAVSYLLLLVFQN